MVTVVLPDGSQKTFPEGISVEKILREVKEIEQERVVAAKVNGASVDLSTGIIEDSVVVPIFSDSEEGLEILRHSTSHVMAQAVLELFPNARITSGSATKEPPGFYYDFDMKPVSEEDLVRIEKRMKEIITKNVKFEKRILTKVELLRLFADNDYKKELINEKIPGDGTSTVYTEGGFTDFCLGPHVLSTGKIKAFKLLSTSSSYWRGHEGGPVLVRIHGTAFASGKELEDYLVLKEKAEEVDHRRLGKTLDFYVMDPERAPAFPLYTPKGNVIRSQLVGYMRYLNRKAGYEEVWTPHAFKSLLWAESGHMSTFKDRMYMMQIEGVEYGMKPMNCPGHIMIFQRKVWSYRDLPVRYSEFGTVYRYEKSGETTGLTRLRAFTQDDGHAFIRLDQIAGEVKLLLDIATEVFRTFSITNTRYVLSTRGSEGDAKYIGDYETWERATSALREVLDSLNIDYETREGEAAFYGPKIDIEVKDALGRPWQLTTIQLDFFMPKNFKLEYIDQNSQKQMPIMIHRAIYGALDRFMGILIEHFGGAFPTWLSPVQVKVLTISERYNEYAEQICGRLLEEDIRIEKDLSSETIKRKIKIAYLERIPYMIILGKKEVDNKTISIRDRKQRQKYDVNVNEFILHLKKEVRNKDVELTFICN